MLDCTQKLSREINDVEFFSERIESLLINKIGVDVILIVEDEDVAAHKNILASCSKKLWDVFCEDRESTCKKVKLPDVSKKTFEQFLTYAYTGRLILTEPDDESVMDLLKFSFQYLVDPLERALYDYFKRFLTASNVFRVYEKATLYGFDKLTEIAEHFIDANGHEILEDDSLLEVSADMFQSILMRESFYAKEEEIFYGALRWYQKHQSSIPANKIQGIFDQVRPLLIHKDVLTNDVLNSRIFGPSVIEDTIRKLNEGTQDLNTRYLKIVGENVASTDYDAQTITGEDCEDFLKSDLLLMAGKGLTPVWHYIGDTTGITVQLSGPYMINHIILLLAGEESISYSYKVEVSLNGTKWSEIIDHTYCLCRNIQKLHFEPSVARYIRVIGTYSTAGEVFCITSFEAIFTEQAMETLNGVCVPTDNVALVEMGARVTHGESQTPNLLIRGDIESITKEPTYHIIKDGYIQIQLAQPYILSSMRLLLRHISRNCSSSYIIKTSLDAENWSTVIDCRRKQCRSWKKITFKDTPVSFVRITGTHDSEGQTFGCRHFECPSQATNP